MEEAMGHEERALRFVCDERIGRGRLAEINPNLRNTDQGVLVFERRAAETASFDRRVRDKRADRGLMGLDRERIERIEERDAWLRFVCLCSLCLQLSSVVLMVILLLGGPSAPIPTLAQDASPARRQGRDAMPVLPETQKPFQSPATPLGARGADAPRAVEAAKPAPPGERAYPPRKQ
jgi:hypothetical protein